MDYFNLKKQFQNQYDISENDLNMIISYYKDKNISEIVFTEFTDSDIDKIKSAISQFKSGKPINRIFGYSYFYYDKFYIDENVLAPRQETELLVERVLKTLDKDSKVLDICTGSGIIAISVQKYSGCTMTATDISQKALEVAEKNADIIGADITFIKSDMFNDIPFQKFDYILCNPPYIKLTDKGRLDKSTIYDPEIALYGDNDGLKFYRILKNNIDYLAENGSLIIEIGYDIAEDVKKLFCEFEIETIKDYNNIERILVIRRKNYDR